MSDNKRTGRGFGIKGYYIALILCAAAIGITSYLYYRNETIDESQLQSISGENNAGSEKNPDVAALATESHDHIQAVLGTETGNDPEEKTLQTMFPVEGKEVYGYAMETLSYNQTTRDWRTHSGIDIAAEAGTQVVAAADGEVYTTYEDEVLGYTVVIRHAGGYTTQYSSLNENLAVKAGDKVSMGDVIGTVDATALVETVLGPHVHFSVTYQDKPMDPADFFAMG